MQPTKSESFRVSVVIPTFQRCDSVQRLIHALAQQTFSPDGYEVIVSIDGSTDGTREMVERASVPYSLRALWQSNQGRAAACNAGIRAAAGGLIILLDDDMEPVTDFLAAHERAHATDCRLGVLGAAPVEENSALPPISRYMADKFNRHLANLAQPDHTFKLRDFYSGNFSIRRERLFQVGLFDETFKTYGNEDLELFLRLSGLGVRFVFCPEAKAIQSYCKDLSSVARDARAQGGTAVLLAQKHPEVAFDTRLGTYHQFSDRWKWMRKALIRTSRRVPSIPIWILRLDSALERFKASWLNSAYYLTLDYLFWLGVQDALDLDAGGTLRAALEKFEHTVPDD
jgi:GT2 family glycosyltransferase